MDTSITRNKYLTPQLQEDNHPILAKSAAQILIFNPHMHKLGPRGPTLYIFGG